MALMLNRRVGEVVSFMCGNEKVDLKIVKITDINVKLEINASRKVSVERDNAIKKPTNDYLQENYNEQCNR